MDQAAPVCLAERNRQTNGDVQESGQIERFSGVSLNDPIEWFTAGSP